MYKCLPSGLENIQVHAVSTGNRMNSGESILDNVDAQRTAVNDDEVGFDTYPSGQPHVVDKRVGFCTVRREAERADVRGVEVQVQGSGFIDNVGRSIQTVDNVSVILYLPE